MGKILLIDDDIPFISMMKDVLEFEGYEIFCAPDGVIGFEFYEKSSFDLVITDLIMPNEDGMTLIRNLKKSDNLNHCKIIAISGGGRIGGRDYLSLAEELGADLTLEKPFRMHTLLTCIKEQLDQ